MATTKAVPVPRRSEKGPWSEGAGNRQDCQGGEYPDHVDIAVSEVDQLYDAVDHRIAQGNNGDDRAVGDADDQELQHLPGLVFDRLAMAGTSKPAMGPSNKIR